MKNIRHELGANAGEGMAIPITVEIIVKQGDSLAPNSLLADSITHGIAVDFTSRI